MKANMQLCNAVAQHELELELLNSGTTPYRLTAVRPQKA